MSSSCWEKDDIKKEKRKRPNILWIYTDEQRADSLGCYGTEWANTPNLDLLAQNGLLFNNHFVNSPICVPSRTSMLSGVYPHQTGVLDNSAIRGEHEWPEEYIAFPEIFADNGYITVNYGKIHYPKNESMWMENNIFVQFPHVATPYRLGDEYDEKEYEVIHFHDFHDVILSGRYPNLEYGKTPVTHLTDMAIEWLNKHKNEEQPFLMRVSYVPPHTPVLAPEPFYSLYNVDSMPCEWWQEALEENITKYDRYFANVNKGDEFDITTKMLKRIWATYFGLITHIDDQIGRLFNKLEALNKLENTIIVFTSDHGTMLGEHGLFQKGMFYRESTRVPLIVSWKNQLPEGKVFEGLTEQVDFAPTLMDLVGIDIPDNYVGVPLLRDRKSIKGKDFVFGEIHIGHGLRENTHPYRIWVRTPRYSLNVSWFNKDGSITHEDERDGFLADLEKDPNEKNNVYNLPKYREIREMLEGKLKDWLL